MFYQQLVQPLINSNMNVNLGVLETAHSIFYSSVRARALSCSARAQQISRAIFPAFEMSIKLPMATQDPFMCRLIDLYYDLTCQDLAPEFEDCHETFFAGGSGYFMQLMAWVPPQLQTDVRCGCLAFSCALRAQTRRESRSAR